MSNSVQRVCPLTTPFDWLTPMSPLKQPTNMRVAKQVDGTAQEMRNAAKKVYTIVGPYFYQAGLLVTGIILGLNLKRLFPEKQPNPGAPGNKPGDGFGGNLISANSLFSSSGKNLFLQSIKKDEAQLKEMNYELRHKLEKWKAIGIHEIPELTKVFWNFKKRIDEEVTTLLKSSEEISELANSLQECFDEAITDITSLRNGLRTYRPYAPIPEETPVIGQMMQIADRQEPAYIWLSEEMGFERILPIRGDGNTGYMSFAVAFLSAIANGQFPITSPWINQHLPRSFQEDPYDLRQVVTNLLNDLRINPENLQSILHDTNLMSQLVLCIRDLIGEAMNKHFTSQEHLQQLQKLFIDEFHEFEAKILKIKNIKLLVAYFVQTMGLDALPLTIGIISELLDFPLSITELGVGNLGNTLQNKPPLAHFIKDGRNYCLGYFEDA